VFPYIIVGQASSVVWCRNGTLTCSTSRLPTYFNCLRNC